MLNLKRFIKTKETKLTNNIKVVLQHGIHTELSSWELFGIKLQEDGFDAWLIEAWRGY